MVDLSSRSISIILDNQHPSGAYIASPNFPSYHYCWYRDGAFTAYAMDLVGEHASARRFHLWAVETILRHADNAKRAIQNARDGRPLLDADVLHTRYRQDGEIGTDEEWPNFQLDGFGTWLWAWSENLRMTGSATSSQELQAAGLVADYLSALWRHPCYDCWEELPTHIHTYTLAAIYGGLNAYARVTGNSQASTLVRIERYLGQESIRDGHYTKFAGTPIVDASLLGLATPYKLVQPLDARMRATVACIEQDLSKNGGVHRHPTDTYYGGGSWVLLAAWLGWYYAEIGAFGRSRAILDWVEAQADTQGNLPEQVQTSLIDAAYYQPWVDRWGPVASPLLWSHAMYLILHKTLASKPGVSPSTAGSG